MKILRGFGRGLGTTLCRELPAFACYFGSYDALLKITNYSPSDDHATAKVHFQSRNDPPHAPSPEVISSSNS